MLPYFRFVCMCINTLKTRIFNKLTILKIGFRGEVSNSYWLRLFDANLRTSMEKTDLTYDVPDACPKRVREIKVRNDSHKQEEKLSTESPTFATEIKNTQT
ncbi:hypothetical protein NPIL_407621 [Nephila pilipes]|uniref:Uncharacterized protein n=1 Tax=Nephila pilipes TaxID=299642 RepID=A0A8X6PF41_NEPPI|nr:hypothetical protein NPIL_407621 [Nephila pilipes]